MCRWLLYICNFVYTFVCFLRPITLEPSFFLPYSISTLSRNPVDSTIKMHRNPVASQQLFLVWVLSYMREIPLSSFIFTLTRSLLKRYFLLYPDSTNHLLRILVASRLIQNNASTFTMTCKALSHLASEYLCILISSPSWSLLKHTTVLLPQGFAHPVYLSWNVSGMFFCQIFTEIVSYISA